MTHEDLINYKYSLMNCKVGTLYFENSGTFFCKLLKDGFCELRLQANDMIPFATVATIKELQIAERRHYEEELKTAEIHVTLLKMLIKGYDQIIEKD